MHVSLQPEETVEVQRAAFVCFYGCEILINTPKDGFLARSHIVLEEHGHLSVEEHSRIEGPISPAGLACVPDLGLSRTAPPRLGLGSDVPPT